VRTHSLDGIGGNDCKALQCDSIPDYPGKNNIAPSRMAPVVTEKSGRHGEISLMRWRLVPFWASHPSTGNHMINARAKTLADNLSFNVAYQRQRCTIPATGFNEWQRSGGKKQPYYFHASDESLCWHQGLLGRSESTYRFIHHHYRPCKCLPVHERMPVMIPADGYELWLNCRSYTVRDVAPLLKTHPLTCLPRPPCFDIR